MGIALLLHILAAVIWVGGMFFALRGIAPGSGRSAGTAGTVNPVGGGVQGLLPLGVCSDCHLAGDRLLDGIVVLRGL